MRFRVALLLLVGALGLAAVGCGGSEEVTPAPETVSGTVTETAEETTEETTEEGGATEGDAAAGEGIFAAQGCGGCHVLEAAGTTGAVGPNLDDSQPDFELVVERVTNGAGAMPAFSDSLDEQQIKDVAAYVVESTSG